MLGRLSEALDPKETQLLTKGRAKQVSDVVILVASESVSQSVSLDSQPDSQSVYVIANTKFGLRMK